MPHYYPIYTDTDHVISENVRNVAVGGQTAFRTADGINWLIDRSRTKQRDSRVLLIQIGIIETRRKPLLRAYSDVRAVDFITGLQ